MSIPDLCEALRATLPALFQCSLAPQGAVRVRTPFLYPDGDVIDVFVEERGDDYLLTDYGEALGWLRAQSFGDDLTVSQTRMTQDICVTLGVEFDRGQLTLHDMDALALSDAVHRVGQAMVRVADIWFTFQPRDLKTIGDEVDGWLREQRFEFQKLKPYRGRSGRVWTVDYEVLAKTRRSLVFLLSTSNPSWARRLSERVVAECSDLSDLPRQREGLSFVSLFDDSANVWREEDFALVGSVSRIATWSRPDEFANILITEPEPSSLFTGL